MERVDPGRIKPFRPSASWLRDPFRAAIDDIQSDHGGAHRLDEPNDRAFLFSGGMRLDLPFTAQLL